MSGRRFVQNRNSKENECGRVRCSGKLRSKSLGTGVTALGSGSVGIRPGFWFSFDIRVYNIAFLFARDVCTGKVFGNFFFFLSCGGWEYVCSWCCGDLHVLFCIIFLLQIPEESARFDSQEPMTTTSIHTMDYTPDRSNFPAIEKHSAYLNGLN